MEEREARSWWISVILEQDEEAITFGWGDWELVCTDVAIDF